MSTINREEYIAKIRTEIERNKGKPFLWADFTLSQKQRDIIVQTFSAEYNVVVSSCMSCKGYDIYIEKK